MNSSELARHIRSGGIDSALERLYGPEAVSAQRDRYAALAAEFGSRYGADRDIALFSVPGRSELSGNHTDHNRGRVIACSVDLDIIAAAAPSEGSVVRIKSEGFPEDRVDTAVAAVPDPSEFGRSSALVAGVAEGFRERGYAIGGLDAVTTSNVLKGSGISSSAAFEVMTGTLFSHLYNGGSVGGTEIALISQYAENRFFGKPCGLMDQMACAAGGIITIDFADPAHPASQKLDFDFSAAGYRLCLVNTGGNHADLTPDYAAVPAEMKSVAAKFGKTALRDVPEDAFRSCLAVLRKECGDRAVLRAMHFFDENRRVDLQKITLRSGDIETFFQLVSESGRSSFCYLQNVYSPRDPSEQGLSLALCVSERFLSGCNRPGACRVHGGGFAGTIQAFVPEEDVDAYRRELDAVFGEGACHVLRVRPDGACRVF